MISSIWFVEWMVLVTDRKPLKKASLSVTPPRAAGLFSSTVLKGGAPPVAHHAGAFGDAAGKLCIRRPAVASYGCRVGCDVGYM
jgi:hypothetical protein